MATCLRIAFDLDAELLRSPAAVSWLLGAPWQPLTILAPLHCQHFLAPLVPDVNAEVEELRVLVPSGLEVVGALVVGGSEADDTLRRAAKAALSIRAKLGVREGSPSHVVAGFGSRVGERWNFVHRLYDAGLSPAVDCLEVLNGGGDLGDEFWKATRLLRCQMQLNLDLFLPDACSASEYDEQVGKAVTEVVADLKSGRTLFLTENLPQRGNVLVEPYKYQGSVGFDGGKEDPVWNGNGHEGISDLGSGQLVTVGSGVRVSVPVSFTPLMRQSSVGKKIEAPLLHYLPAAGTVTSLPLNLDVLCVESIGALLSHAVAELVLPALCNQLVAMQKVCARNPMLNPKVAAYHFWPEGFLHPVTGLYDLSYGETELGQVEQRKKLHERLGLPLNRPLLRVANALDFTVPDAIRSSRATRLRDVHAAVTASLVRGGTKSLVQGSYEYFHYLQDHVDDNGWGCAYRSLQTIVSWFKLQHYTSLDVPSHREIQEILVDIGDKERSFVGSREWIGAIELSFVLDKLLGVSSKILNVNSGAELPGKCRELALHFKTQGTPIMIGGGVLAYTLLGIDFNEFTGESAFLILDPHYTGGDDLKPIVSGGWCGWKKAVSDSGEEFFLRNKFYNLLLPQRPITV